MPTVITAFDLPDDRVDATIGAIAQDGRRLYRGLAGRATFALIAVSRHSDVEDAVRMCREDANRAMPAFSGVYGEHDVGGDPDASREKDSVTFVNCLRVASDREDVAFAAWKRVNDYMVAKPGYLSHVLFRRLRPDAAFAFVNVVRWISAESLRAAQDPGFVALTSDLPFIPRPSLCRPVPTAAPAVAR